MSVLVAGSLHLDVIVHAPHLPALDETVAGSEVRYVFGGKGGNQALAASCLGGDVKFVGRTGSDGFGTMLREALESSGMDLSQLQRDDGPSGMSTAIIDANGDYGAVIVSAANLNIDADEVGITPDVTLVLLQNEIPEDVNLQIAQKAKAAGAQVWLNAAPARVLSVELLNLVDLLIVNRVEAAFYEGADMQADVLTTLGADGVLFQGQTYPGHAVDVISTHGAGDMFVGALAAEVGAGVAIQDAIVFAQAAAALQVASTPEDRETFNHTSVVKFMRTQDSL